MDNEEKSIEDLPLRWRKAIEAHSEHHGNTLEEIIEYLPPVTRDQNEVGNLSGQELLDALTESWNNGEWNGWTFSDIARGGSILPMIVSGEDQKITKHIGICMTGMNKGEIADIELVITTSEGTRYKRFVPG